MTKLGPSHELFLCIPIDSLLLVFIGIFRLYLRNGPDKNDSNNVNEHVGMQKRC